MSSINLCKEFIPITTFLQSPQEETLSQVSGDFSSLCLAYLRSYRFPSHKTTTDAILQLMHSNVPGHAELAQAIWKCAKLRVNEDNQEAVKKFDWYDHLPKEVSSKQTLEELLHILFTNTDLENELLEDENYNKKQIGNLIKEFAPKNEKEFPNILRARFHLSGYPSTSLMRDKIFADNKALVLSAISEDSEAFIKASSRLQADEEVALLALVQNGLLLEHAKALQNNKRIVLVAVSQNGNALQFAAPELQDDDEVVACAVRRHKVAIGYASERLQRQ